MVTSRSAVQDRLSTSLRGALTPKHVGAAVSHTASAARGVTENMEVFKEGVGKGEEDAQGTPQIQGQTANGQARRIAETFQLQSPAEPPPGAFSAAER